MKSSEKVLRETEKGHSNFIEDGRFSKAYRRKKETKKQCFTKYNIRDSESKNHS